LEGGAEGGGVGITGAFVGLKLNKTKRGEQE